MKRPRRFPIRFLPLLFFPGLLFPGLAKGDADNAPEIFSLWPEGTLPGPPSLAEGEERDLTRDEDRLIAGERIIKLGHVSQPEVHVYLPPADQANGTAVVICPGGGFSILAWDLEGTEVAEWLQSLGVTAVVLKYRVPTRQHGDDGTVAPKKALGPMMDAQRALSLARSKASQWKLDPDRIGILGFSAGGATAALAAVALGERAYPPIDATDEASCEADFALLVYPGGIADRETGEMAPFYPVGPETPPMFFVHAADDRVTCLSSTRLFTALKQANVPAELHVYATGGHGYGMRRTEEPVTRWPEVAATWMRGRDLLPPATTTAEAGFEDELLSFAEAAAKAREENRGLPQFSVAQPNASLGHAEIVQRHYVRRRLDHRTFGGIKGAVVGKGGQDALGLEGPVSAVLFREGEIDASRKPPVVPLERGIDPGIETELGLLLVRPVEKRLKSVEELKDHVQGLVPVVELPAGKHEWPQPMKAIDLVAANVDSDRYLVGEVTKDLEIDLDVLPIQLFREGEPINETQGGAARNGQWHNFLHQVNWAIDHGYQLEAGHLVITGALGTIARTGAGRYRATFGDLGEIRFTLEAP